MSTFSKFSDFKPVCTSKKDAIELAKQAELAAKEFDGTKRVVEYDFGRAAQKRDNLLKAFQGKALDSIRGVAAAQFDEDRRAVLKNSEPKRYEPLQKLKAMADQAEASLKLFQNPLVMATAHELGSHERGRYHDQIKNAPPAALRSLATKAASEKNLTLAAALIAVNEERAEADKSFSSQALAEQLFGAECRAAIGALQIAARNFEEVYRQNREIETGRKDGLLAISRGMKDRKDPPQPIPDDET